MKIIQHWIIFHNSSLNSALFDLHAGCGVFAPILHGFCINVYLCVFVCICFSTTPLGFRFHKDGSWSLQAWPNFRISTTLLNCFHIFPSVSSDALRRSWIWCHHRWSNNFGSVICGCARAHLFRLVRRRAARDTRNTWSNWCGRRATAILWSLRRRVLFHAGDLKNKNVIENKKYYN